MQAKSATAGALILGCLIVCAAANAADTDGDFMSDTFETSNGFDPANPDENGNGRLDGHDDEDGDLLANRYEEALGCDPGVVDTDGDGLADGDEIGTGVYGPELEILTSALGTSWTSDPLYADVDSDGDDDLVVVVRSTLEVWWYENDPSTPGQWTGRLVGTLTDDGGQLFAADFDNDGDTDLVASADSGFEFVWFRNNGANTLSFTRRVIFWVTGVPRGFVIGDFDSDLDQDVVALTFNFGPDPPPGYLLYFFENDLLDTQPWPETLMENSVYWESAPHGVADINGDGEPNVLIERNGYGIEWLELSGSAPFTYSQHVIAPDTNGTNNLQYEGVGDLDSDGNDDLVIWRWPEGTLWVENSGGTNPSWTEHSIPTPGTFGMQGSGDFDLDGDLDILSAIRSSAIIEGELFMLENQGTSPPTFTAIDFADARPISARGVHQLDIDGDLDLDLVVDVHGGFYWREQKNLGDPAIADTDSDGLDDGEEQMWMTDPFVRDTDLDGASDGYEVASGTDPLDPDSTPDGPLGVPMFSIPSTFSLLAALAIAGVWWVYRLGERPGAEPL